jgi:hypothetical protein
MITMRQDSGKLESHQVSEDGLETPNKKLQISIFLAISILYGLTFYPIADSRFFDYSNYLIYAEFSEQKIYEGISNGLLYFLFNEPAWLYINLFLSKIITYPDNNIKIIVFFSSFIAAFISLKKNPKLTIWVILILCLPIVAKSYLIHIRQGLAVSLFLIGFYSNRREIKWLFLLLAPLVHVSFFFIYMIYVFNYLLAHLKTPLGLQFSFFAINGLFISFITSQIAGAVGARQVHNYTFSAADVSGASFIFWFFTAILMLSSGRRYAEKYNFEISCVLFYLSSYYLTDIVSRVFESAVLLVMFACLNMKDWRFRVFGASLFMYGVASWVLRSSDDLFGFGYNY